MYRSLHRGFRTFAVLTVILAPILLGMSCLKDKVAKPFPESHYLPQSSAANCLTNLMTAYNERNFDEYMKLFPNDFTFEFSPKDAHRPDNPTPLIWGRPEEQTSAYKLFSDSDVNKIELNYSPNPAVPSGDEYDGTWKILQDKIALRVYTTNEDGSTLIWLVDQANDWFYFKEYPDEKASDGKNLWRIWRWKDEPEQAASKGAAPVASLDPASPQTEQTTWGQIKHLYK